MRILSLFALLCCFLGISYAQTANSPIVGGSVPPVDTDRFPTYALLQNTIVPKADRLSIARRLLGYEALSPIRSANATLSAGMIESFFVLDTSQNLVSRINAELWGVGQHAYLWIETGAKVDYSSVVALLEAFDARVYHQVRELWGEEAKPGIDGDERIHLLFARPINPGVAAYFTSQHAYPAAVSRNSNEREMIIFNLNEFENVMMSSRTVSVMAHEFQHMIRHNVDGNESAWVDEGFSIFTEKFLGLDDNRSFAVRFLEAPNTQLNNWGNAFANYGASLMFMQYFYERFGLSALQRLSVEPADGLIGIDKTLKGLGHEGVDVFFADWVLANLVQNVAHGFGYHQGWAGLPTPTMTDIARVPYTRQDAANQYGTHYYTFLPPDNATQLLINLQKPSEAKLLPENTPNGTRYWYSNIGDESDTTLTRSFDLRGLEKATMIYRLWYSLETHWDYMYVVVSTDGGQRWTLLPAFGTTIENPNDRAYGVGYTGPSVKWVTDKVDLTPFVGQEVLVRFEMVTDDAKTLPGVALDDIAIPELGYREDFEADDGGWLADGWILSDNRLPQRTWVQAVQYVGDTPFITRWLAEDSSTFTLPLLPSVERVVLAISPFAPVTTVPMTYTLSISTP